MHTEHAENQSIAQCMQLLGARFWIMLMNVENKNHHAIVHKHSHRVRVSPTTELRAISKRR